MESPLSDDAHARAEAGEHPPAPEVPPHWATPAGVDTRQCDPGPTYDTVVATGTEAGVYLQSQLSQSVLTMQPDQYRWAFALEPTGKIVALTRVRCAATECFELDVDAGYGAMLLERLARFRIRIDVQLQLREATSVVDPICEDRRVVLGWPRLGAEIIPGTTLVAQTGLAVVAIDFTKGCYPGQELVERMDSRAATAPSSLRIVSIASGQKPGDPLLDADGVEVGRLTSVAGEMGLAMIRRGAELGESVQFAT
jgi:folate-binding protein YgfZ